MHPCGRYVRASRPCLCMFAPSLDKEAAPFAARVARVARLVAVAVDDVEQE